MKKFAVVVGIDAYPERPLQHCAADAEAISTVLRMPEYAFDVLTLVDSDATRSQVLSALREAAEYGPDQFLFYFSGHGAVTNFGGYLVCADSVQDNEGIELSVLARYLETISRESNQVISILDCCHAGAAFPWSTGFMNNSDVELGLSTVTDSRIVLAACRADEFARERESLGHGIFTNCLIDGLTSGAIDFNGNVTVGSLYEYVAPKVEAEVVGQRTIMRGDVGGRVVIGEGFPPRFGAPLTDEVLAQVIGEGYQLLSEYGRLVASAQHRWRESGHREAAQQMTAIARWFETQLRSKPELKNSQEFKSALAQVQSRISQLGSVDSGTVVARGLLSQKLGSGGFGTVWRVDDDADRKTALKLFHPADFGESDKLDLFSRGYRAMAKLDHPRVVSVYEYTTAPIGFYMDFIDGPNLRQVGELVTDPGGLLRLLMLAAETIQHAHSRGVVHRDIKPENILLSYDPDNDRWLPHLTDFDLAWFSTATSVTQKSFGNLYYAAPEQLAKPHSNAARAKAVDIYAFGQLAFFAFTGSNPTPFALDSNVAVLRERISTWISADAAQEVVSWYCNCVSDDPSERPSDFADLIPGLARAEVAIRSADTNSTLDADAFVREIGFGLSGFGAVDVAQGQSIRSLSGRTQMEFRLASAGMLGGTAISNLEVVLWLDSLEIEGQSSDRAQALLLRRVNLVVDPLPSLSRKSKYGLGSFAVELTFAGLGCTHNDVLAVRDTLSRVVDAIER